MSTNNNKKKETTGKRVRIISITKQEEGKKEKGEMKGDVPVTKRGRVDVDDAR